MNFNLSLYSFHLFSSISLDIKTGFEIRESEKDIFVDYCLQYVHARTCVPTLFFVLEYSQTCNKNTKKTRYFTFIVNDTAVQVPESHMNLFALRG